MTHFHRMSKTVSFGAFVVDIVQALMDKFSDLVLFCYSTRGGKVAFIG